MLIFQVFPYGSVPLKTYLLDGDIDLTALCSPNVEEALSSDVHAVLKGEERNENAEFEVRDIQFITAEVDFSALALSHESSFLCRLIFLPIFCTACYLSYSRNC